MTSHLFVYGTLMSGGENHHLLVRKAELIGPGRMRGRFFLVDYYPGLVESDDPGDIVVGEVWRLLEPEILHELDELEGCTEVPPLFIRASRTVTTDGDGMLSAWVYVYARSTAGLPPIPSGDWRAFRSESLPSERTTSDIPDLADHLVGCGLIEKGQEATDDVVRQATDCDDDSVMGAAGGPILLSEILKVPPVVSEKVFFRLTAWASWSASFRPSCPASRVVMAEKPLPRTRSANRTSTSSSRYSSMKSCWLMPRRLEG
jgi:gamma-glutamylcyclotransferase (GGCT)/AIG2-like uncharacterized protein YtfP